MPLTDQEHTDNLIRHIELVKDAAILLGKRLITDGRPEFGRLLIARGFTHDNSKFKGIEWEYLHAGRDIPQEELKLAIKHHQLTNPHHPAYWGGITQMPEIAVAEMVCDWYARSHEFGTGLREWIKDTAITSLNIPPDCPQYVWIGIFVDLILRDYFRRDK